MICCWWSKDNFKSQECSCNISEGQNSCRFIKSCRGWGLDEIDEILIMVFFTCLWSWCPSFSVLHCSTFDLVSSNVDIASVEKDGSLTDGNMDPVDGLFIEVVRSNFKDIELPFILEMSKMKLEGKNAESEEDHKFHFKLIMKYDKIDLY